MPHGENLNGPDSGKIFGLNYDIDLNGSINELPAKTFITIREKLDTNPADRDWRALARVVENEYHIEPYKIERWSPALTGTSAAAKLLTELSSQGMIVKELVHYLNEIHIDTFPLGLSPYADVQVIRSPPTDVEVYEGDTLILEVEATGQPYPRYQWFFCQNGEEDFNKLQGRTENTLRLDSVTKANAGSYSCQIHNCRDPKKTKITDITLVSVVPNPLPHDTGLNPPSRDDVIYQYSNLGASSPSSDYLVSGLGQRSVNVSYSLILGHPKDVLVGVNEPFVLSVDTHGDPPIMYQWYKDGVPIPGQVGPKLSVPHATMTDFGRYICIVKNGVKQEQSNVAVVKEKFPRPDRNPEIVLVSQPKSVSVKFGGCALFSCEARCCEPLKYQWFKDGSPIPGETESEIKFMNIQDRRHEGFYQCEISVDSVSQNTARKLTAGALLTVDVPSVRDNVEYNPSDKVALLIGNSDYKSETPLTASTLDVQVLSESFRALDFRVLSLLNLTKPEIENAVLHFCELVDENVYVVFYFCGHGFEEHGLSYLVPTDAPAAYTAQECVCAQTVLANIQKKQPALILMIMDICRQGGKVKSNVVPQYIEKTVRGNTVFCYATSVGLAAYENRNGGLLVHHLQPLIRKKIGIDALIGELKEEFNKVRKHSNIQIPQLVSNLLETRRSLTDRISKKGQTEAFQIRDLKWNAAHEKPKKQTVLFHEVGVAVELDFQSDFSNVLHIFTIVTNPGKTHGCVGKITNFSPPVSAQGSISEYKKNSRAVTKITLQDIQKLKDNLVVEITITFFIDSFNYFLTRRINLGQPLVAKLRLWEQGANFVPSGREAVEQAEEGDN